MPAVDRLDVQFAADPLAGRLVERLMGDPQRGGARWIAGAAVGDQQGVLAEHRRQARLDGIGVDRRQDGGDGGAGSVGGYQDRHLLIDRPRLAGFAAAFARLAIRLLGIGLSLLGTFPGPRSLAACQDKGLVGLDDAAQIPAPLLIARRKRCRQRKAVLTATPHRSAEVRTVPPRSATRRSRTSVPCNAGLPTASPSAR